MVECSTSDIVAEYAYDAQDRGITKTVTNSGSLDGITHFVYDAEDVIAEDQRHSRVGTCRGRGGRKGCWRHMEKGIPLLMQAFLWDLPLAVSLMWEDEQKMTSTESADGGRGLGLALSGGSAVGLLIAGLLNPFDETVAIIVAIGSAVFFLAGGVILLLGH